MVMLTRPVQPAKAQRPMAVTLSGIVILLSPQQSSNTFSAILHTPLFLGGVGIVIQARLVQPAKAPYPYQAFEK